MWQCSHCNQSFSFNTTHQKANHSRWCDKNPKAKEYRENQIHKKAMELSFSERLGEIVDYDVICDKCSKMFVVSERQNLFPTKEKYFCSRKCANSHRLSDATKNKIRDSVKLYFNSTSETRLIEVKQRAAQREKQKHSKTCEHCSQMFLTHRQNQRFCSVKCGVFNKNQLARSQRAALINYRSDCAFKFNLKDFPEEFDFSLIEKHGWYKAKNRGDNLNGVSRDHIISVRYGFDNNIDPKILSHPANCQLLRHTDNISKNINCELTFEELLNRIKRWDEKYPIDKQET